MVNDYPLILSLDTATRCSSVALTRGTMEEGEVLASLSLSSSVTHSRRLLTTIDWLFSETQIDWPDLGGVAVGLGPGSFTGLRIGMATAKGLAATAGLPLLGVSTLDTLAANCVTDKLICAVLDARKKEVYAAFYRADTARVPRQVTEIVAVKPEELLPDVIEPLVMVGDGIHAYGEYWFKERGNLVEFAPPHFHTPSAASLGLLAGEKLAKNDLLDLPTATPVYVRASDAELSLVKKKDRDVPLH